MNEKDIFIRNLKNLMIKHELNQKKLGNRLGVNPMIVSHLLNGTRELSMPYALKICEAFNVTMREMFTLDEQQYGIEDIQETNKDNILQLQKEKIERLEDENDTLKDENEELKRAVSRYDFMQDNLDGKVKLIRKGDEHILMKNGVEIPLTDIRIHYVFNNYLLTTSVVIDEFEMKG